MFFEGAKEKLIGEVPLQFAVWPIIYEVSSAMRPAATYLFYRLSTPEFNSARVLCAWF